MKVPVEGVDYHFIRVKPGMRVERAWRLFRGTKEYIRNQLASSRSLQMDWMGQRDTLHDYVVSTYARPCWAIVRGPEVKLKKEWGPVCL